jgi:hypothetical protein
MCNKVSKLLFCRHLILLDLRVHYVAECDVPPRFSLCRHYILDFHDFYDAIWLHSFVRCATNLLSLVIFGDFLNWARSGGDATG